MEKFDEIIEKIKNQETISPPDNLVNGVMAGVQKIEKGIIYKFTHFLYQPRELSSDAAGLLSGKIMSHRQCSFLLFSIGLFYLLMGLLVIWGMKDVLNQGNINLWLRAQPHLTILSAILIISMAVMVSQKPQTINFAQYGIIAHTSFIVVNALILEFMLFSPQAIVFVLVLTAAAIMFGVILISSIRSFIKSDLLTQGYEYVQNI